MDFPDQDDLETGENVNNPELEAFDAFNDDTFGAAADAWDEDGHEELAKTFQDGAGANDFFDLGNNDLGRSGAGAAANDFFELGNDDDLGGLGECLEAPGSETLNGGQDEVMQQIQEEMAAMRTSTASPPQPPPSGPPPNHDSAILNAIPLPLGPAPEPRANLAAGPMPPGGPQGSAPPMPSAPPGGHSQHKPEFVDPAIMSMGSMPLPPPPSRAVFPAGPPPQSQPVAAAPMTVEELERQMMAQQDQQQQIRHLQQVQHQRQQQQQQQHQQQQQQQQHMMQQQMMMRAQMQRQHQMQQQQQFRQHQQQHQQQHHQHQQHQHQQHHPHQQQHRQPPGQQQHQHHMHQGGFQSRQQQLHHQFQSGGHQQRHQHGNQNDGYGDYNNGRRNQRSRDEQQQIYDDKDRETFGDDFVADHQKHENPLMMPGHVQTQNILRGARRNSSSGGGSGGGHDPSLSTGIPALDLAQQSGRENSSNQSAHRRNLQEQDEFAGLMNQRERQWVINIQLNQLKDENDYYYTVFNQKKKAREDGIDLRKGRRFFFGEEESDDENEDKRMFMRDEETLLLLKSESMSMDSPRDEYTPLQYENSLGKLQAVTVKAPRKIIDMSSNVLNQDAEQLSTAQKDSRNFKKTLLQLERLYYILIDVEDCEKKLAVLPTGIPLRSQVESDGKEGIRNLGLQLVREDKLKLYIAVRKGKQLLIRALRWLNTPQMRIVCTTLLQNYSLAVKKDRDDKLLKEFWHAGIRRHVLNCSSLALLHYYLTLLTGSVEVSQPTKSGSILKNVVNTPLGMSILLGLVQRLALLHQFQPNADTSKSNHLLMMLGKRLHEDHSDQEKFSVSVSPLNVELPNILFNNKDMESDSYKQLQKLVQAGLQQEE